jgi:Na+/H+ antiporter NhaD/arsenite permease-like protein
MVNTQLNNDLLNNDPQDDSDDHPSLYNISVYGKHTYHHSGIFHDPVEPGAEREEHASLAENISGIFSGIFPGDGVLPGDEHKPVHAPVHVHAEEVKPSKLLTPVAIAIVVLLACYGFLLFQGIPQNWTKLSNVEHVEKHGDESHGEHPETEPDTLPNETDKAEGGEHAEAKHHPPYFMIAPFAGLLCCIAFFPLIPKTAHWWESNTNRFLVAASCGAVTLFYYAFFCHFPVEGHWPYHHVVDKAADGGFAVAQTIFANAIMSEFVPFIVLLFSLFVITGGIRISGNFKATPFVNTCILTVGTLMASFIGTTGAAMLLIRFLLETNRRRKYRAHTVILFIFTVCNGGGCLTPLGDPPLFLGYLRGVPFEWTLFALWPAWLFLNVVLLSFYFLWDSWFYRYETEYKYRSKSGEGGMESIIQMVSGIVHVSKTEDTSEAKVPSEAKTVKKGTGLLITGWRLQVPLLLGIVASVAFLDPSRPIPVLGPMMASVLGSDHPPFYLREAVQLALAAASLFFGSYHIRKKNAFNFLAIGEVAALFFGIFICMQVPLQIINVEGKGLVEMVEKKTGLSKEPIFYWGTASVSVSLDNAPTYVVFFETAKTLSKGETVEEASQSWREINEEKRFLETARSLIPTVDDARAKEAWAKVNTDIAKADRFLEAKKILKLELDDEAIKKAWRDEIHVCDVHRFVNAAAKLTAGLDKEKAKTAWREADNRFIVAMKELEPGIEAAKTKEAWATIGKKRCYRELVPVSLGKNGFIDHFLLIAVALGTVFVGGMSYIANGPNFMVKAIAEQAGIKMPSFFGFMVFACIILLPVIFITSLIFV